MIFLNFHVKILLYPRRQIFLNFLKLLFAVYVDISLNIVRRIVAAVIKKQKQKQTMFFFRDGPWVDKRHLVGTRSERSYTYRLISGLN